MKHLQHSRKCLCAEGAKDDSQGLSAQRDTPGTVHKCDRILKGCEKSLLRKAASHPFRMRRNFNRPQGYRAARSTPGYFLLRLRRKNIFLKAIAVLAVICILVVIGVAQKKMKPWNEWSEKEATKMLNDSPWGQTQSETNTSEMFFKETPRGNISSRPLDTPSGGAESNDRSTQGSVNQAMSVYYRIRLLTAKPIRQAIARQAMLKNPQLAEQLKAFAEQKSDKYIVVAVDYDSPDKRFSGSVMQIFNSANTGTLKTGTYLETKSGKRLFLDQYMAPINDGMGAKFVFPRTLDGQPFVTDDSGYLRFYSELTKNIKLNMRFKVSDMMYDGALEY